MVHIDVVGMDESQGETKLRIFDMYGRVMLDKAILGSGLEPVDVLQYPSGVYNISVTQGDKLHQKQFIKVEWWWDGLASSTLIKDLFLSDFGYFAFANALNHLVSFKIDNWVQDSLDLAT